MSVRNTPSMGIARLVREVTSLAKRVSRLEHRPDGRPNASHQLPIKLGSWVLSEDSDSGDLLATNVTTGAVTVLATA